MQNILYALIQSIHNIGAVLIVGVGAYGLFFAHSLQKRMLAAIQAIAWSVQGLTGGAFGLTTFYFYHQFPDIHGIAIAALFIKISCVVLGFLVSSAYTFWSDQLSQSLRRICWISMFLLGVVALTSASFLRWFS